MGGSQENAHLPAAPRPGLGIGEIDAKSVIPDDQLDDITNSHRKVKINAPGKLSKISTTTKAAINSGKPLDDVEIDEWA